MSKTTLMRFSLLVLFCVALVSSHSQMRCVKYNKATGACSAPIRDQGYSFMRESNLYTNGAPICQSPFVNPISSYYANGAGCPDWAPCPAGMGSFTPGESFTIMWFARNHAIADQSPATVSLYMSPAGTSADPSADTMRKTLVCSGPYMNCNGKSGNEDPCTLDCKMPTNLASGTYSLWWKWDWQGVMYTTCADVKVTGGSSTPTPSTPTPTPTTPTPTPTTPTPTPTPTTPTPTTPKPSSTTLSPNNGNLCYLPNTPFLNAKLGKSGRCGSSSKTRCPDGSCCSKHGYCGTTADYCTNNQGDYRKYACSTVGDKGIVANQVYEGEEEQFLDNSSNSMTVNFVLIVCSMLLYVTMF